MSVDVQEKDVPGRPVLKLVLILIDWRSMIGVDQINCEYIRNSK